MSGVHWLNIEYLFYFIYQFFSGTQVNASGIPDALNTFYEDLAILGVVCSVVLITLIIYSHIRAHQVEHHGFHLRQEEERHKRQHVMEAPKNPRWEEVVLRVSSPQESDWRRAIIEADVMLADLLTLRGYRGDTLGEQLKDVNPLQFTTIDLAWEAHKMRNALSHLGEAFPLSERDARATIDLYRRVFEEFQYI